MILIVNTAEETLQALLVQDGRVLDSFQEPCSGRMNEVMGPAVERLLSGPGLSSLTALACVRGPGSFTGLRLGLAYCHGLSLARELPMAGLDHLPLLADSAFEAGQTFDEVHVLTHSRTARVYHQAFAPGPEALSPPRDLTAQAACDLIAARADAPARKIALLGTGLRRNAAAFAPLADLGHVTLMDLEVPSQQALVRAAQVASYDGPPVEACYLRGSDAEENLAAIAAGRGLSEAEALARMEEAMK
ncbi:tRNA (adenosine(37)-N6)-threonylcarbamoyltransferase complex dimerization subunit type 1 TsaB [Fundidesulfovibrio putealis]|uniref:tRNA (adenosine(37)-N6)-threonylcarbamoyltransferase complex dimerization subunit type 1 TsaB n=1 Tax=Fundidesulfovibrio putealis TaxID=270496 RepID=UPI00040625C7|nr:tRNA (adenosine(37)-N6)-threonylcarbamoyltransferase complex dimerization subunit type 1 TsaB [Fundidesulfovibrio putealis]